MTRKYDTRCWMCGSKDLEPDDRGIKCRSCGTTYNVIPKPGGDIITYRKDVAVWGKTASPSAALAHQTSKAKESEKGATSD